MFNLLSVTNRRLCQSDLITQIRRIAMAGAEAVILREKDLLPQDYLPLAQQAIQACRETKTLCILHTFTDVAIALKATALHLPLPVLRTLSKDQKRHFPHLGASCHSLEDVREATQLGCTYVTLGHIFPTDCKPGVPARGLSLLHQVCLNSSIPVYAIGGMAPQNIRSVREAGAAGACLMSSLMTTATPEKLLSELHRRLL